MKKLLIVLLLIVLLSGCKKKEKEIEIEPISFSFNGEVYTYLSKLENGYDLYRSDSSELELLDTEEVLEIWHTLDNDIYFIAVNESNLSVEKNGSMIITCSRDTEICTGFESPVFKDDLFVIADKFK